MQAEESEWQHVMTPCQHVLFFCVAWINTNSRQGATTLMEIEC